MGVPYRATIEGVHDRALLSELKAASHTDTLKDTPPATPALLRRRVERDRTRFLQLLKSRGFYGAGIHTDVDTGPRPALVTFHVTQGPPYTLARVMVKLDPHPLTPPVSVPTAEALGLAEGSPIRARAVLDAGNEFLRRLKLQGFPFPKLAERRVVVDHAVRSASISLVADPGPTALLARPAIDGLLSVKESVVRVHVPWKEGDRYGVELLEKAQRNLSGTGLFSTVRVTPGAAVDDRGLLPVTITLTERTHRSIAAGLSYKTDEGPGLKLSWEHRNAFHGGERVRVSAAVSDFTRNVETRFQKPFFLRDDQWLRLSLRAADDRPDAYTSKSVESSGFIDRELPSHMRLGAGAAFKDSRVTKFDREDRFRLVSLPVNFQRDTSDDLLNPARGGRAAIRFTPFVNTIGEDFTFFKAYARYRHYIALSKKPSLVGAASIAAGTIRGARLREIPADELFYAGGGGSIRGYSYQSVGTLVGGEPEGGRSLLEMSAEVRLSISERMGVVLFMDGGSAFAGASFDSREPIRWGAGTGLRYFTPIGPLRFDVGVPLDRREGIDDSFQIYVSLGQAF